MRKFLIIFLFSLIFLGQNQNVDAIQLDNSSFPKFSININNSANSLFKANTTSGSVLWSFDVSILQTDISNSTDIIAKIYTQPVVNSKGEIIIISNKENFLNYSLSNSTLVILNYDSSIKCHTDVEIKLTFVAPILDSRDYIYVFGDSTTQNNFAVFDSNCNLQKNYTLTDGLALGQNPFIKDNKLIITTMANYLYTYNLTNYFNNEIININGANVVQGTGIYAPITCFYSLGGLAYNPVADSNNVWITSNTGKVFRLDKSCNLLNAFDTYTPFLKSGVTLTRDNNLIFGNEKLYKKTKNLFTIWENNLFTDFGLYSKTYNISSNIIEDLNNDYIFTVDYVGSLNLVKVYNNGTGAWIVGDITPVGFPPSYVQPFIDANNNIFLTTHASHVDPPYANFLGFYPNGTNIFKIYLNNYQITVNPTIDSNGVIYLAQNNTIYALADSLIVLNPVNFINNFDPTGGNGTDGNGTEQSNPSNGSLSGLENFDIGNSSLLLLESAGIKSDLSRFAVGILFVFIGFYYGNQLGDKIGGILGGGLIFLIFTFMDFIPIWVTILIVITIIIYLAKFASKIVPNQNQVSE